MAYSKHEEIGNQVITKWTGIAKDVIKAVNCRHRSIVFVRAQLLNKHWVQLTIIYNQQTGGQLLEIDKRISINEFMSTTPTKLVTTICSTFEVSMGHNR